jgi:ubiquinone/menaquinone biosynthesis C-methylase UbiE
MDLPLNNAYNHDDPALVSVLDELPFWSAPFGLKLLEKIVPRKNMTVLDIGYCTGFPLIELAMRLGDTCKVYGIDPWQAAADRATEKIRIFGINNIELLAATAEKIPLSDHSVDLVVSNNGLNNVPDMDRALGECSRLLKPGRRLLFTMNLDDTMTEFYDVMREVLSEYKLFSCIEVIQQHIYQKRKPLDEIIMLLRNHSFAVNDIEHNRFSYTFADGTAMFRHFFIRLAFLDAWLEIVPKTRQEEIFNEIERRINRISDKEGYFRLSVPFAVIEGIKK